MSAINIYRDQLHIIAQWNILARLFFLHSNRSVAHQNRFDDNNFNHRGAYTFKSSGEQKKFIPVPINCGVYVWVRCVYVCLCVRVIYRVPTLTRTLCVDRGKKNSSTEDSIIILRMYLHYFIVLTINLRVSHEHYLFFSLMTSVNFQVKFPSLCSISRFVFRHAIHNIII